MLFVTTAHTPTSSYKATVEQVKGRRRAASGGYQNDWPLKSRGRRAARWFAETDDAVALAKWAAEWLQCCRRVLARARRPGDFSIHGWVTDDSRRSSVPLDSGVGDAKFLALGVALRGAARLGADHGEVAARARGVVAGGFPAGRAGRRDGATRRSCWRRPAGRHLRGWRDLRRRSAGLRVRQGRASSPVGDYEHQLGDIDDLAPATGCCPGPDVPLFGGRNAHLDSENRRRAGAPGAAGT